MCAVFSFITNALIDDLGDADQTTNAIGWSVFRDNLYDIFYENDSFFSHCSKTHIFLVIVRLDVQVERGLVALYGVIFNVALVVLEGIV